jgi:hypothetical protein
VFEEFSAVAALAGRRVLRIDTVPRPHLRHELRGEQLLALAPVRADILGGGVPHLKPVMEQIRDTIRQWRALLAVMAGPVPQSDLDEQLSTLDRLSRRERDQVQTADRAVGPDILRMRSRLHPQRLRGLPTPAVLFEVDLIEPAELVVHRQLVIDLKERHRKGFLSCTRQPPRTHHQVVVLGVAPGPGRSQHCDNKGAHEWRCLSNTLGSITDR